MIKISHRIFFAVLFVGLLNTICANEEVDALLGGLVYDPTKIYAAKSAVMISVSDGEIYTSKIEVPAATDGSNGPNGANATTYWGDSTTTTNQFVADNPTFLNDLPTDTNTTELSKQVGSLTNPSDLSISLINISTRGYVGTGNDVLIAGFVLEGDETATKKCMIGVTNGGLSDNPAADFYTLKDPFLSLMKDGQEIATNDDWTSLSELDKQDVESSGAPSTSKEPALVMELGPGAYTAIVSGVGGTTGVTNVGVNDLGQDGGTGSIRILNISTRGKVLTGDKIMIAGFVISGGSTGDTLRLKLSNNGASLGDNPAANFYTLKDPSLQLTGGIDDSNDNWQDRPSSETDYLSTNNQNPSDYRESFMLKSLSANAYTLIMRGSSNETGIAVVGVTIAD
jgi:hypothetical protein